MIKQLIEALQIFAKYVNDNDYITHCEHDELYVVVKEEKVSEKDKKRLKELGFDIKDGIFSSYRHGSA